MDQNLAQSFKCQTKVRDDTRAFTWSVNLRLKLQSAAHLEVLVVLVVIPVEGVEVLGELPGPGELVDVDEGVVGRHPAVLLLRGPHHDREHVVPEHGEPQWQPTFSDIYIFQQSQR